jgi:chromosome partitioning protein
MKRRPRPRTAAFNYFTGTPIEVEISRFSVFNGPVRLITALRIVVMNTKGGCGKTTVATNLASYCVSQGYATALFDYDAQGSSSHWSKARPQTAPAIRGVEAHKPPPAGVTRTWQLRVPEETRYLITDTPAGHTGIDLADRVGESDIILIPVLPSAIDIHSTANFIRDLLLVGKARAQNKQIAIIANRTRVRTKSLETLERFLRNLDIPVIAHVRDTQNYVRAAALGLGVCELAEPAAQKDKDPWANILRWLQGRSAQNTTAAVNQPSPLSRWVPVR